MSRPATLRLALLTGGLAVALSACGSATTTSPAASTSGSAATTSSSAPSSSSKTPTSTAPTATSSTSSTSSATSGDDRASRITVKDFMFEVPASVPAGSSITVTNADNETHTVTSKAGGFDVKVAGHGGTATLQVPAKAGRYDLTCDFHADMSGVLVVS